MSVVRLIVATRSSGPPASQPVIKEMPDSVASGTHCSYKHEITGLTLTLVLQLAFPLV
jgi:hypothetical protein